MGVQLGNKPSQLTVYLTTGDAFAARLLKADGTDWDDGTTVNLVLGSTPFLATVDGPALSWHIDAATWATAIAGDLTACALTFGSGSAKVTIGAGLVVLNSNTGNGFGSVQSFSAPGVPSVSVQPIVGPAGPGVIGGGASGSVLAKASSSDFDTEWVALGSASTHAAGDFDSAGAAAAAQTAAATDATTKASNAQSAATSAAATDATAKVAAEATARASAITAAVTALVAGAPGALDTLNELATALGDDQAFATTVTNALAAKAPLASPSFTGSPLINGTAAASRSGARPVGQGELSVNVKDHGAVGDGASDDTAAFTAAVAALSAGAELYLPAGSYLVSQVLLTSLSSFSVRADTATLIGSDPTKAVLRLVSCSHFKVTGVSVQHQNATVRNSTGHGINLVSCSDYFVNSNTVTATAAAGIISFGGTDGCVAGNVVANTLADGIHHSAASTRITVAYNRLYNTGDDSIAVVGYQADSAVCSDVTINGNAVNSSNARGIAILGCDTATISGNIVDTTTAAGIYLAQETGFATRRVANITVSGNTVKAANTKSPSSSLAAIFVQGNDASFPVRDIVIVGNNIVGSNWQDVLISAGTQGNVSRVTVLANAVTGNLASHSMTVVNGLSVAIRQNVLRNTYLSGIQVDAGSSNVNVDFNLVYLPNQGNGATSYGIVNNAPVSSNSSTALNLVFADAGKTALLADVSATDATGRMDANRNLSGNQLLVGAATRSLLLNGPGGSVVMRNDGSLLWGGGTNPGGDTIDAGLTRAAAGVVKTFDGASGPASLKVTGGLFTALTSKTASYSLTSTDSVVMAAGTGITLTLPSAVTAGAGREYLLKNTGTATVTVAASAGTVDATTLAPGVGRSYISDGTNWWALRADVIPPSFTNKSGAYIQGQLAVTTSAVLVNGSLRLAPLVLTQQTTVAALGAEFTAAGDAASLLHLALYADDGTGYPGALLIDGGSISTGSGNAGTVATGGTPGVYTSTLGAAVTLPPGLYWVGAAVQGVTVTQPTIRTGYFTSFLTAVNAAPSNGNNAVGYFQTGVTGTPPSSFAVFATASSSSIVPRVLIKLS